MKKLGVVEGFYGSLMSFSQRNSIIESLSNNNLNFYLYAPKEDPFIRKHIDLDHSKAVSYTHLTLPTTYTV